MVDIDIKPLIEHEILTEAQKPYSLVLWNDDVNTFEWVIETLVAVCKHSPEQAEQCAMLIHFQGKYAVKNGDLEELSLMKDAIVDRQINATIEKNG